jgi:hypothetical protein
MVLFAGAIIGFVALAALAVDVAMVYSLQQTERTAADAAALAGAQDLQIAGSRSIDSTHQISAVQDALDNLVGRFRATGTALTTASGSNCTPTAGSVVSVTECALVGTPYWVTIKTPSPSAVDVAPNRAVQVTVRNSDVPLTFARLFGQHDWNVSKTSVAGIAFGGTDAIAIATLRTPVSGRIGNSGDITIDSNGGEVNAIKGDIAMNTGDVLNGHGATVQVSDGYYVHYYGSYNEQSNPPGPYAYLQLPVPIPDPFYMVPTAPSGTPTYTTDDTNPLTGAQDVSTSAACSNATAQAVTNGYPTVSACYKPGVYNFTLTIASKGVTDLLEPGVYWFNLGLTLKGNLIGGVQANAPGVALVIPQESGPSCGGASSSCFIMNGGGSGSANVLALNRGATYTTGGQCGSPTNCATAALMPDGTKVETNTRDPLPLSVIVAPDPLNPCPVTVPAPSCSGTTIDWAGAGGGTTILSISGVVYAPSDSVKVTGSGDPKGYLGQMWTWAAKYSGSATLNQYGPGTTPNGSVRLDQACSGGSSPCSP